MFSPHHGINIIISWTVQCTQSKKLSINPLNYLGNFLLVRDFAFRSVNPNICAASEYFRIEKIKIILPRLKIYGKHFDRTLVFPQYLLVNFYIVWRQMTDFSGWLNIM